MNGIKSIIKNPYPNYGKCFIHNCNKDAVMRIGLKDGPAMVYVCVCSHCVSMDKKDILSGIGHKKIKGGK